MQVLDVPIVALLNPKCVFDGSVQAKYACI